MNPFEMNDFRDLKERVTATLAPISAIDAQAYEASEHFMNSTRSPLSSRLPPYQLVYFLLVDLLKFINLGRWEKVAWIIPLSYQNRIYTIEHRKFGLGLFTFNNRTRNLHKSP